MSTDYATVNLTKRDALLGLISDCEWHPHYDLLKAGGVRYSARLLELRRLGYLIETENQGQQGKVYRLTASTPGFPQSKRVKVYLEEKDVLAMMGGIIPTTARAALADAHGSFNANREKL